MRRQNAHKRLAVMYEEEQETMRSSGEQTRLTEIWEEGSQHTVKPKSRGIGAAVKEWFGQRKTKRA